ncbi:MAG: hypothetical protein L3K08_09070, partial [Thermoplasmata archaeon]|nr:hypothetical protein [Thermoplasmata archaeon]
MALMLLVTSVSFIHGDRAPAVGAAAPAAVKMLPPVTGEGATQTSAAAGVPYVSETLDLLNQTLHVGNWVPGGGLRPYSVVYDPVHQVVFIGNLGTNFITVVDGVQHKVIGHIAVRTTGVFTMLLAGENLYVAGYNLYLVQVFNTTTWALSANIALSTGPCAFGYDAGTQRVFVATDTRPWELFAVSNVNFTILGSPQSLRPSPGMVVFDPVDNELLVGDGGTNVNILNGSTMAYVTNLTMGDEPFAGIWDPFNDLAFLVGQDSDNITVV